MNVKPLGNTVLVRPLEEKEQTTSGIIVKTSDKGSVWRGKVLSIGPEADQSIAGEVMFKGYGADQITVEKEKLMIVNGDDILCLCTD